MQKVVRFVAVSYGLAAAIAALTAVSGISLGGGAGTLIAAGYMFTPLIAVLVVQKLAGEPLLSDLGARPVWNRWLLVASLSGAGIVLLVALCGFLLPGIRFDPSLEALISQLARYLPAEQLPEVRAKLDAMPLHPVLLALPQVFVAGATINAIFAFGEEIGWRGLLHRELAGLGFWRRAGLTGLLWGLWHAPIILLGHNYPEHPVPGVLLFTVVCVLLAPIHALVRERSGSVWAAAICHGTFNAAAGLPLLVTRGGTDLTVGVAGLAGVLGLVVFNLGLALWLRRSPSAAEA